MKKKNVIIAISSIVIISLLVIAILFFKTPKYEVTFSTDNEVYETIKVKEDGTVKEPTVPTKEGYKFIGWYYNGEKFDFSTKVTKDMKLVAKWVKEDTTIYTIKFDSNGGNEIESIETEKNKSVGILPTPKKNGYKFVGWYIGSKKITETTIVIKDMNLVAKWEKVEKTIIKTVKPVKTTIKVEQTTKKSETTEKVTTKPVEESTTKKHDTTSATYKDKIEYEIISIKGSTVGEAMLYLLKNNVRVSGTCDITDFEGDTITIKVPVTGFKVNDKGFITKVDNIKLD